MVRNMGPPGVAPGLHRLRVGRTVLPILWALKTGSGGNRTHGRPVMSRLARHLPSLRLKNTHPGLAPGKIGFADRRFDDFAMCVRKKGQVRGSRTHPAGFTGPNAAATSSPEKKRAPARTCTSTLRLRTAACTTLTPREQGNALHHAGAASTHAV